METRLEQMRAEYQRPGLGGHLSAIRADKMRRVRSERPPDSIVTAPSFDGSRKDFLLSPVKGSVMLFWSAPRSKVLAQLERAYANGDDGTLRKLSDEMTRQMEERQVASIEDGLKAVLSSPLTFDLRYGTKELASSLVLPEGVEFGAIAFPYNGGPLDDDQFTLVQHHRRSSRLQYRTLLVRVQPDLTDIERAALDAVPIDQSIINIGEASMCPAATVALVAVVVALVTRAGIWNEMATRLDQVSLSAAQIKRLGPLASAQELVALRGEIFEEYGF